MLKSFSSNQIKTIGRYLNRNSNYAARHFSLTNSVNNPTDGPQQKEEWKKLAQAQLKGKSPDTLVWQTAEVKHKKKEKINSNQKNK
jgi:hypothetical protein